MEANNKEKLDGLIRKSVKEAGLESPSVDFTKNLMTKIKVASKQESVTVYKPLISKVGWGILAIIVLALSVFALDQKLDIQLAWLEKMNMGALPKVQLLDTLPNFGLSNIFFYSILIFAVFAVIQLVLLKQRLDRQYV